MQSIEKDMQTLTEEAEVDHYLDRCGDNKKISGMIAPTAIFNLFNPNYKEKWQPLVMSLIKDSN